MRRMTGIFGPLGLALILVGSVTYGILHGSGFLSVLPLLLGFAFSVAALFFRDRTAGGRRQRRLEMHAWMSIALFLGLLVFLQTIATRHDRRFDTTANRRFSLAPQTRAILAGLEKDVAVNLFFKDTSPVRRVLEDLVREYAAASTRLTWRFVDPDRDPVAARRYGVGDVETIVVESGERDAHITETSEEALTNAILKVVRPGRKTVCFTTGHGEKSIDDEAPDGYSELGLALAGEGYDARELLLATADGVPDSCEMLVIAGPSVDLFPREEALVDGYLDGGGKVLMLLEPMTSIPRLCLIAYRHGIEVRDDMVIDRFGKLLAGNYLTPVVNTYGDHAITRPIRELSFFPQARSVLPADPAPEGVEAIVLCKTAQGAYSESDLDSLMAGQTRFDPEHDAAGPVAIAAVASRDVPPGDAAGAPLRRRMRLVVFGDADFAMNANVKTSAHRDLILNTIGWLAEQEDLISIRPRDPLLQPVVLSDREGRVVFWIPVVAVPLAVAGMAAFVSIRRRRSA